MKTIGVLALQGSVEEHVRVLDKIEGVGVISVKSLDQLEHIDGLIIPGGESTTMGKLLNEFKLMEPLRERVEKGMPIWGTCAGMILLAKEIVDDNVAHIGMMNISVRRNAYGSQLDSFKTEIFSDKVSVDKIPAVFIRAPWVEEVGDDVEVLAVYEGRIVAVKQKNILATSFHPELTDDISFHKYFANMIVDKNEGKNNYEHA